MFNFGIGLPFLQPIPVLVRTVGAMPRRLAARRQDQLLDDALKATFPASDPVSVSRIS